MRCWLIIILCVDPDYHQFSFCGLPSHRLSCPYWLIQWIWYAVVPNLLGQLVASAVDKAKDIVSPVDDLYSTNSSKFHLDTGPRHLLQYSQYYAIEWRLLKVKTHSIALVNLVESVSNCQC